MVVDDSLCCICYNIVFLVYRKLEVYYVRSNKALFILKVLRGFSLNF